MSESINLSWPLHSKTLIDGLWKLALEKLKTDCEVYSKENIGCQVHQLIISIFCPQLFDNLNSKVKLTVDNLQLNDLKAIIEFLYRGEVTVFEKQLDGVLIGARFLGLNPLIGIIEQIQTEKNNQDSGKSNNNNSNLSKKRGKTNKKSQKYPKPEVLEKSEKNVSLIMEQIFSLEEGIKDKNMLNEDLHSQQDEGNLHVEKCSNNTENAEPADSKVGMCTRGKSRRRTVNNEDQNSDQHSVFDAARNQHVCEFCDKGFVSKDRYSRHIRCHQNPEQLQHCPRCDYKTGEKYILIQHLASRHRLDADCNPLAKDLKCPHCEFRCVSNFQLRNHAFHKHSTKSFKCQECDYSCVKKADHDKHVRAKHRNERPYMCELCGYRGKTLSAFKCHARTHTGEKPFTCDICGQSFSLSGTLRCHRKVHGNEEKPHPCHLCNFSTWKRYNLKVHLKHVHKDLFSDDAICEQVTAEWRDMKHHRLNEEQPGLQHEQTPRVSQFDHHVRPSQDCCSEDIQFLV